MGAADVSCSVRVMNGGDEPTAPITRDFLGGCFTGELDLDLPVPCGWEKRLDLKTGKIYVKKCSETKLQTLNLFDDKRLSSWDYPSVCTLDKVKLALERAEKEGTRKRSSSSPGSTSSSDAGDEESPTASIAAGCPRCLIYVLVSRGNPKCPRCNNEVPFPATKAAAGKKPRIDLNMSI